MPTWCGFCYGRGLMIMALALSLLLLSAPSVAANAEDAWNQLVGPDLLQRDGFEFVKNRPGLPNVFLYGDSISMAYTPVVRELLAGKVNLYRLHTNGGESASLIPKMEKLQAVMGDETLQDHWSFQWDLIHFNVGLHDLKYIKGNTLDKVNGRQVATLQEYERNLRKIVVYLKKLAPQAQLVFATTTPVPKGGAGRFAGDAVRYNRVAWRVMREFPEILINDLYSFTKPHHAQWWLKPGNVHYNQSGVEAQGKEVARVILEALKSRGQGTNSRQHTPR